jgi:hypothetical protein
MPEDLSRSFERSARAVNRKAMWRSGLPLFGGMCRPCRASQKHLKKINVGASTQAFRPGLDCAAPTGLNCEGAGRRRKITQRRREREGTQRNEGRRWPPPFSVGTGSGRRYEGTASASDGKNGSAAGIFGEGFADVGGLLGGGMEGERAFELLLGARGIAGFLIGQTQMKVIGGIVG